MTLARVIVASNRAAAGVYPDRTGPLIVAWLRERGFTTQEPVVVPDGEPVTEALRAAVADGAVVAITTGGTGINPTDRTPEATRVVLDHEVPGLADAIRAAGLPAVPTAVLSRGVAGVAGQTLVVNLPGSTGGVRDGLGVLDGVLTHAVDQLHGGDHPRPAPATSQHGTPDNAQHGTPESVQGGAPGNVQHGALEGRAEVVLAAVADTALSVQAHADLVADRAAGAVVTFGGVVRDHDGGRSVHGLEYVGHPSAGDVIAEVADEVAKRHPGVRALAVSHRIGVLEIGDVALACAVAADHRREAFAACADLVDEVKLRLPVWKRQSFADGSEEWVNCP